MGLVATPRIGRNDILAQSDICLCKKSQIVYHRSEKSFVARVEVRDQNDVENRATQMLAWQVPPRPSPRLLGGSEVRTKYLIICSAWGCNEAVT